MDIKVRRCIFFYFVLLIIGILRFFLKLGFSAPYNIPLLPTVSLTELREVAANLKVIL